MTVHKMQETAIHHSIVDLTTKHHQNIILMTKQILSWQGLKCVNVINAMHNLL